MLREGLRTVKKKGLHYVVDQTGRPKRLTPWLGDRLAFLYDWIMDHSVLPKKLAADPGRHTEVIREQLTDLHGLAVLELGTGTGNVAPLLPPDNRYAGVDVSAGLLRRAVRSFARTGFENARLYVTDAADLPFADESFDVCLCHLSLNFFPDADAVLAEVARTLRPAGTVLVSVPVPERNRRGSTINGTLRSEDEIRQIAHRHSFEMETFHIDNGAVLYFQLTGR